MTSTDFLLISMGLSLLGISAAVVIRLTTRQVPQRHQAVDDNQAALSLQAKLHEVQNARYSFHNVPRTFPSKFVQIASKQKIPITPIEKKEG